MVARCAQCRAVVCTNCGHAAELHESDARTGEQWCNAYTACICDSLVTEERNDAP